MSCTLWLQPQTYGYNLKEVNGKRVLVINEQEVAVEQLVPIIPTQTVCAITISLYVSQAESVNKFIFMMAHAQSPL